MRRIRSFLLLIGLFFSVVASAQQFAAKYDQAAAAYQSGNFAEAETLWTALAAQGDPNSQYAMGIMHLKKEAKRSQDGAAFRYLVDAAKKQHVAAMFNLGVAYWEGRGVNRQPEKAVNWWEVAAQRQDAGAQYNLGLAYYIGEGRAQDTSKAIYWADLAAKSGHPQAKSLLRTLKAEPLPASMAQKSIKETSQNTVAVAKNEVKKTATGKADTSTSVAVLKPVKGTQIRLTTKLTELRAAPSVQSTSLATLKAGVSVRVIKPGKKWSQVVVARSYPVWVYETFLQNTGNGTGTIKGDNVNIRPRPSTDKSLSPALGQLNNNDSVSIVLKRSPWVQIIPAQVLPAWVASKDIE